MPGRKIVGGYRYQYQGQEVDPETGKEAFQLRLWDGRIGRWLTTDPKNDGHSPYLGMNNNPISIIDPDGGSGKSTGVEDLGNGNFKVVGARNDGDTGVYVVDSDKNWNINTSTKIGDTPNPWSFMYTVDTTTDKFRTDIFPEVTFNLNALRDGNKLYTSLTEGWESVAKISASPVALAALAILSRNGGTYDLKDNKSSVNLSDKHHRYTPVLFNGKITPMGSISNTIFGANLRTINAVSLDQLIIPHQAFYMTVMPAVGKYNVRQNNVKEGNFEYPFFGEHTYSGTSIFNGFFGSR